MLDENELTSFSFIKARLISYHRHTGQIVDASQGQHRAARVGKPGKPPSHGTAIVNHVGLLVQWLSLHILHLGDRGSEDVLFVCLLLHRNLTRQLCHLLGDRVHASLSFFFFFFSSCPPAHAACLSDADGRLQSDVVPASIKKYKKSSGLLVHFHGGGFVGQSSKAHEIYLRRWAKDTGAVILSVDYTLAPEGQHPRMVNEAFYAYCWAIGNCTKLGTTAERVVVAGDSAGGNLSVVVLWRL